MKNNESFHPYPRWIFAIASGLVLVAILVGLLAWNSDGNPVSNSTTAPSTDLTAPPPSKPLKAPTSSVASDAQYLSEVTEVDPALTTYEKKTGNVALRSLLTDGSAFCAFLKRDGEIDTAMVSVVVGARQVESQTHLPMSVTTFNTVDSVALLTLCPSLQSMVPPRDLAKIRHLGAELAAPLN